VDGQEATDMRETTSGTFAENTPIGILKPAERLAEK